MTVTSQTAALLSIAIFSLTAGCKLEEKVKTGLRQQHFTGIAYDKLSIDSGDGKPILRFERHIKQANGSVALISSSYPANELLVGLKPGVPLERLNDFLEKNHVDGAKLEIVDSIPSDNIYNIRVTADEIVDSKWLAKTLLDSGLLEYAEPNYLLQDFSNQFLHNVDASQWPWRNEGRERTDFGGKFDADTDAIEAISRLKYGEMPIKEVTVAVIDGGINIFHNAFKSKLWENLDEVPNNNIDDDRNGCIDDLNGWNFASGTPILVDNTSHGTHVAGIIGAGEVNGNGISGIAINARLMICKTSEANSHETLSVIKALKYAITMKADVVNISLGHYDSSTPFETSINDVLNANIPIVAALGNDGLDVSKYPTYPACYRQVIAVANSDNYDNLADSSNYSTAITPWMLTIAAPGERVFSTTPGNYGYLSGTSMAAPHVTSAVALIKGAHPDISLLRVLSRLAEGSDSPLPLQGKVQDRRRLNVYKAVFGPAGIYDDNGVPYRDQLVNGRFRSSLSPYANSHEPGIDGSTMQKAFKIASINQLMSMRDQDTHSYFILTNNLDWEQLDPNLPHVVAKTFNGTLDGAGYTIKNFRYQSGYPTGLFNGLGPNAVIRNLRFSGVDLKGGSKVGVLAPEMNGSFINDVQVEGSITGNDTVGSIVGSSHRGQVNNCYFEGSIYSSGPSGNGSCFGGICGVARATNFLACHAQVHITGGDDCGGIAGSARNTSNLDRCYANAVIHGKKNVGGLVGSISEGDIRNSYADGYITATSRGGGLIGSVLKCMLSNSYAYIEVACRDLGGGMIADGRSFNMASCYYLNNGTNPAGIGGSPRDRQQLLQQATFRGWFPSAAWGIHPRFMPALKGLPRSYGALQLHASSTPMPDKSHNENNRLIWRWGDFWLSGGISLFDVRLSFEENDVMTLSFRLKSRRRYSRNGYHPWVRMRISDTSGRTLTNWEPYPGIPVSCNTDQVFTKSITVPGIYRNAFSGDFTFSSVPLRSCD